MTAQILEERETFTACPACGGDGSVERGWPCQDAPYFTITFKCDDCAGSGWIAGEAPQLTQDEIWSEQ